MGGGVGKGCGSWEAGAVGDRLLQQLLGFCRTMQAEQGFGAVVEQSGIGRSGGGRDQRSVERVGLIRVASFDVNAGQQAADVAIGGMGGVQLFE